MPRSYLFVPGDSERKLSKALTGGADALMLDLEDSVAPSNKPAARATTARFVAESADARTRCWVRVNAFATGMTESDVEAVLPARPAGIVLPKCDGIADVERIAQLLSVYERKNGIADGSTRIIGISSETAQSVLNMPTLQRGHPRLAGLMWGAEDLAADLGAASNRDADGAYAEPFRLARTLTLLAAKAAGVEAIDTVFTDIRDLGKLEAECRSAKALGFDCKAAIHPDQVPVINRVYTPTEAELEWARTIVDAFAAAPNEGVLRINDKMIDQPHLKQAQRLLRVRTG